MCRSIRYLVLCLAVAALSCGHPLPVLEYPGVTRIGPLEGGLFDPAWSPDGDELALNSFPTMPAEIMPQGEIYILDLASGRLRLLLKTEGVSRAVQGWSPDGKLIAYANLFSLDAQHPEGIWVVNVDGHGEPRFIAQGNLAAWSPNGREMAIHEYTDSEELIWVLDLITGDKRVIFRRSGGGIGYKMSYSPDGTRLAFGWSPSRVRSGRKIYLLDLRDGTLSQLTTRSGHNDYPTWSPDGKMLAYVAEAGQETSIMIVRADGRCSVRLLKMSTWRDIRGTAWSPDGRKIAFWWEGLIYAMDLSAVLGEDFLSTGLACP